MIKKGLKGSLQKKNVTSVLLGSDPPLFSGKCKHFKHVFEKCNETDLR